jgi:hypothetical protein
MRLSDVKALIIPQEFGTNDSYSSDSISFVADQLDDVQFKYGMTKFVLMFNEEEVIKIPFDGEFYYTNEDNDEEAFTPFREHEDYCALEEEIYIKACDAGVGAAFAETRFLFNTINGTPAYISERVLPLTSNESYNFIHSSADSREKARALLSKSNAGMPREWLASVIEYYGSDFADKLIAFINKEDLYDFHSGNLGFRKDGSPVLLDYSGYDE